MSAVDDALARADGPPPILSWQGEAEWEEIDQVVADWRVLAAEVKRLRKGLADIGAIGQEMQKLFDAYWAAR